MRQQKQDRRSRRTRSLVSSALMDLLLEKRYDAITVQDILDRAGISRTAFYAHYYDKADVLTSLMEQQLEMLSRHVSHRETGDGIVPSLELFEHVQKHHQRFQAILRGHAGEFFWETTQTLLSRSIEQTLTTKSAGTRAPAVPLAATAQYLAGGLLALLKWWLSAELPYSPEQMDEIFRQLALPGVKATIGDKRT